jgi:hypothetical protein
MTYKASASDDENILKEIYNNAQRYASLFAHMQDVNTKCASLSSDDLGRINKLLHLYQTYLKDYHGEYSPNPLEEIKNNTTKKYEQEQEKTSGTTFYLGHQSAHNACGNGNSNRLAGLCSRLFWESLDSCCSSDLSNLYQKLHMNFHIENLKNTVFYFNIASVAVFALRFSVDAIDIVKHALQFTATTKEKEYVPYWLDRAAISISKHLYHLGNDIVWGTINLFTNYPQILGLSPFICNVGMVVGLAFDFIWLYVARMRQIEKHEKQKIFYAEFFKNSLEMLEEINKIEDKEHNTALYTLNCSLTAAFVLVVGLSIVAFASSTVLVLIGNCLAIAAMGIYNISVDFGKLAMADQNDKYLLAIRDITLKFLASFVIPVLLMGIYAFSPAIALAMVLVYVTYEMSTVNNVSCPALGMQGFFAASEKTKYTYDVDEVYPNLAA